ncbi:MAG: 3'-5' exonuclease, partial [Fimbriimonadaceae bacterium]
IHAFLSPMQHRLIDSLVPASLLLVGDSQQSIYAFRQAEVRLFQERMARTPVLRLRRNYRSTAGVLAFVDTVFGSAWKDGYVPMSETVPDDDDPFARRSVDGADRGGSHPPTSSAAATGIEFWEVPRRQEHSVAQWVGDLIAEGESPRDIAVLVRRSATAQTLLNWFDQIGVPARIVGGSERFYTRLEVRDLAVLLRAVANPEDDFALLATLLGPAVGVSLDTAILLAVDKPIWPNLAAPDTPIEADRDRIAGFLSWFAPLADQSDRYSAAELLSRVFAQTPYLESIARRPRRHQALANVRKLFRLAAARPELGPADFAREIREIRELRHKEGDAPALDDGADAVTILTVHKAKGLEFPVVVVPETLTPMVRSIQDIEIDRREGLVATSAGTAKGQYHAFISERRKALDAEEEKRLLYVAMTRAKRRLCLVVSPNARSGTVSKLISEATGYPGISVPGVRLRIAEPDESP